jgi:hypothetical protein
MNWNHSHNFAAGLGLIVLVNAIALAGAAWNRSEPVDSRLQLSERELGESYANGHKENSGIALRLDYRWPNVQATDDHDRSSKQLTTSMMAELGFKVPTELNEESVRRYRRQLDRDGLLVLEFDGPQYQRQLQHAQDELSKISADLLVLPTNKDLRETQQIARDALQYEQTRASRLFVVDAGSDQAALRAKYPDRQRYAIVRGKVSAWSWHDDGNWQLGGSAQILVADNINLPQRWHQLFGNLPLRKALADSQYAGGDKLFNAELVFGQRLEPWISQLNGASTSAE